jgi:hypothetical protein
MVGAGVTMVVLTLVGLASASIEAFLQSSVGLTAEHGVDAPAVETGALTSAAGIVRLNGQTKPPGLERMGHLT